MATWESDITADGDDGYEEEATTSWNNAGSCFAGYSSGGYNMGFRYQSVGVPQGATINSATITLKAAFDGYNISNCLLRWRGDDVDTAAAWGSSSRPSQITPTDASTAFDPSAWVAATEYPFDVKDIIQEIVNRAGWASGQHLRLALLDDGGTEGYLRATDYSTLATDSAHLYIDYTEVTGQFARPAADRTDGSWLNSAGTPDNVALYSYIDETSYSDADYIRSSASPSSDTCIIDLSSIATPQAGTVTLRVRAKHT